MDIYWPEDETDRRAIVRVTGAHSHPVLPEDKLTAEIKEEYGELIERSGMNHPTVGRVDQCN
jgi:hypothetical protein